MSRKFSDEYTQYFDNIDKQIDNFNDYVITVGKEYWTFTKYAPGGGGKIEEIQIPAFNGKIWKE